MPVGVPARAAAVKVRAAERPAVDQRKQRSNRHAFRVNTGAAPKNAKPAPRDGDRRETGIACPHRTHGTPVAWLPVMGSDRDDSASSRARGTGISRRRRKRGSGGTTEHGTGTGGCRGPWWVWGS
jgi:hypothetical protein